MSEPPLLVNMEHVSPSSRRGAACACPAVPVAVFRTWEGDFGSEVKCPSHRR